ncbi:MAG: helix-turn-helix domain-containing protein [Betaproteobacteria bacterium]|nr:helix-turn-helix domain-containing protein [Betaproteobacteria bacterium]MDH4322788.1 helix-turn-helix domain-containing protein [Betaproteobacteria bacterium]MDH5210201.1 helix-turn-helix domain-containing protein [Betaproteobacteria bacterium]MDH5578227.1 helix-turn-helix domain-containing protein [Betaproteobacteria bacterium]
MSELPADTPSPAPAPAVEPVGAVLARAREAAGLAQEEAARRLKFAPRQLDALERGEWGRLPGGAAVRGMVRSYARLLDLDADALVARVGEGQALPDAERLAQRFRQPVPFSDGARRSNVAYVVLSVVLLAVVAAVVLEWRQERAGASRITFVSAAQQPAEPARAEPARAEPVRTEPARIELASAAPQASAAVTDDETRVASGGWRRIVLRFERESWVEITSGTGKLLVSHLHPAGSERVVVGVPPFSIVIGNAQHVQLTYNDRPVDLMPHVKVEVARLTLD